MSLIKSISGVRGTIGGNPGDALTPIDIVEVSAGYALWLKKNTDNHTVVIGRDGRISGALVQDLVTNTLTASGINVIDIGLSTTPTVEMAVVLEKAGGGIIITASHNPKQWNALKLLNDKGEFISAEAGEQILSNIDKKLYDFVDVDSLGKVKKIDNYIDLHIDEILKLPLVDKTAIQNAGFKVVLDSVNSTGGLAIPKLLTALGVTLSEHLYPEISGHFAHNPEPLPEHLTALATSVVKNNADLGISVDPDVDRLALVNNDGTFFGEEYTLVAVADYILTHKKGSTVSNLSSSRALRDIAEKHGCKHYTSAVGEVNVVTQMKTVEAVIGGEGNGGIIYPELHYGRDALVGIALFLSHLAHKKMTIKELRDSYPPYYISKNKIDLSADINLAEVLEKVEDKYKEYPLSTIDGVRIDFEITKEWVHLRRSNTEPIIRVYAESSSKESADILAHKIMDDVKKII